MREMGGLAARVGPARVKVDATTVRFLVTGGGAAGLFFALTWLGLAAGIPPVAGTLLAYGAAFTVAYTVQRRWTFGGAHRHRDTFPRYLATQVGCALLACGLARMLVGTGALPSVAVAGLSTVGSSAVSYLLSRYWVFASRDG